MASSPCIGYCELDSDSICLGCYRSLSEIGAWMTSDNDEQKSILKQAEERKLKLEGEG